jgi:hypothetical protein
MKPIAILFYFNYNIWMIEIDFVCKFVSAGKRMLNYTKKSIPS